MNSKKMAAAAAAMAFAACAAAAHAETVDVNGSTTVLPAMQLVAESFMKVNPNIAVTISGTGSGNGIKALRDKTTDIAMSSRDLKDKEVKDFESHGMQPVKFTVAHDAIIPVVNPKNKVQGLTKAQLRDVFAGKIRDWKDVGGDAAPIVVIGRDSSSGTFECFQELVMGKDRVSARALLQASNGGVVQAVTANPNAIGYVGIGYLEAGAKGISVDGVAPTEENAKAKKWPISRDLYLFTIGQPQGGAKALIDYMLGKDGQAAVQKSGYLPVAD